MIALLVKISNKFDDNSVVYRSLLINEWVGVQAKNHQKMPSN